MDSLDNFSVIIANGIENKYTTSNSFIKQKMTLDYIFVNEK